MKKILRTTVALMASMMVSTLAFAQSQLASTLKSIESVASVQKLETSVFPEKYLLKVTRPVNPEAAGEMTPDMQTYVKYADPAARKADAGTFEQRVFVCHRGYDKPTVIVTEGYWADYAMNPAYQEEISRLFDTNLIVVEYRYFGESTPEACDWQYLTVANSLCDLHHVVEMLKPVYPGKWISTGISKGGQTTMFFRSYYPDDVDISVPYVAPLNKALEDGRHEPFLSKQVGTAAQRQKIEDFMMDLEKNKAELLPMFQKFCDDKGYVFRVPVEEIYDLCVLEVRYAMWQWGTDVNTLPKADATIEQKFRYFIGINDPDYFALQTPYYSFNVMAAKELGYYGYDMKAFKKYMSVKSTKDYLLRVMLGGDEQNLRFDDTLYKHVVSYLKKNDPKMMYIYGGIDPWGCSGVAPWLNTSKKQNLKVYVKESGSHSTRINSFEEPRRSEIISTLKGWLSE